MSSIADLIIRNGHQRGAAPALISPEGVVITHGQLAHAAQKVDACFRRLGMLKNDIVAMAIPTGFNQTAAFLTTAYSAAAAPLNPGYRLDELVSILTILQPRAALIQQGTDEELSRAAGLFNIPVLTLKADDPQKDIISITGNLLPAHETETPTWFAEEKIAVLLATSGTTAAPKIIPLSHQNLISRSLALMKCLELSSDSRLLNINPVNYSQGVTTILAALMAESSVICAPGFDGPNFLNWLKTSQPTWYSAVPAIQMSILDRARANKGVPLIHTLKVIRSTGAPLPNVVRQGLEDCFKVPIADCYGSTEGGQIAMTPLDARVHKAGTVGLSMGPEIGIIDSQDSFQPPDAAGEIVVRGESVVRIVINSPAAPKSALTGGWFKTGDLGCMDADGYLTIIGRVSEMINRAGEKISPYEVDEILQSHPKIAKAATFGIPHPRLGEEIAAAVVLSTPGVTEKELRDYASKKLADFKVPRRIFFVTDFPGSPTGKINRTRLAELFPVDWNQEASSNHSLVTAESHVKAFLTDTWCELLQSTSIGEGQSFLDLGGESLVAARLASRIRARFRINIHLVDLMDAPTIDNQAELIIQEILAQIESDEKTSPGLTQDQETNGR